MVIDSYGSWFLYSKVMGFVGWPTPILSVKGARDATIGRAGLVPNSCIHERLGEVVYRGAVRCLGGGSRCRGVFDVVRRSQAYGRPDPRYSHL